MEFDIYNLLYLNDKLNLRFGWNNATWWIYTALRLWVWGVFNHFLLITATDRNNISSHQPQIQFGISLYPLSFFANSPFKQFQNRPVDSLFWSSSTAVHNIWRIDSDASNIAMQYKFLKYNYYFIIKMIFTRKVIYIKF